MSETSSYFADPSDRLPKGSAMEAIERDRIARQEKTERLRALRRGEVDALRESRD